MGIIQTSPGSPLTTSSASGGKVWAFNNIGNAAPVQVLAGNPARQTITFHNPGAQDIFVFPQTDANGNAIAASNAALGGTFRIYANGGALIITGECQQAWSAFAASATNNPFTAMESNV